MKIIGLNGEAGSGKDTVYGMIRDLLPERVVQREAFADRLKVSAAAALGFDGTAEERIAFCNEIKQEGYSVQVGCPGKLLRSISGREYLQRYGTESHRDVFSQDFWLDAVLPVYDGFGSTGYRDPTINKYVGVDVLVITDVRFDNEAERVKSVGGEVWYIARGSMIAESAHQSETPINPMFIDRVLPNNGTLDQLREQVEFLVGVQV